MKLYFCRVMLHLKKYILAVCLVACVGAARGQASFMFHRTYVKPYRVALNLTNPASAMSKYGVALEYRRDKWAYHVGRYWYTGVYQGKQCYDFGWKRFLRKQWEHEKNHWVYQDFFYWRVFFGESEYHPEKFKSLGLPNSLELLYNEYIGAAAGYGRRYQKGPFFIQVRGGLRGTFLGLPEEQKIFHRLFYVAGPGSVVEVNANFGVQF